MSTQIVAGDRLAYDPDTGKLVFHPAGHMIALTDETIEEDGEKRVYAAPYSNIPPLIARICAPVEGTTTPSEPPLTTETPGECPVKVYQIVFVDATFDEQLGVYTATSQTRSPRKYFAAAPYDAEFGAGDLVVVIFENERYWVIATLTSCSTPCETTTTSTSTSTTTQEPGSTTTTTQEPGSTTTTTSTTTQEPGSTSTTTSTTTTTQEPGSTTQEPGSTTTSTTETPCDLSFSDVPYLRDGETVAFALVLTTDGCLRKIAVSDCDTGSTTTSAPGTSTTLSPEI